MSYSTDSAQHRANQRLRQQEHAHRTAVIKAAANRKADEENLSYVKAIFNADGVQS
jgi:hypothetical protein